MDPWWNETTGRYVASFGGAGLGMLCGVYGALVGALAPKGKARRPMIVVHVVLLSVGVVALILGVIALASGQPRHVWYPLLLVGGILSLVLGFLLPVVRRRYEEAKQRRVEP